MLKLKDKDFQKPVAGLPGSYREWWDLGGGYEIYISIGARSCGLGVDSPDKKDITIEVAKYLNVDITTKNMSFDSRARELYLSPSIDCYMLNYTKPEKYKELLEKIEKIVEEHFKNR